MAGRNRIEKRDGLVRKHFASHLDYSRESRIYEKLQGSGLAPELTTSYDGLIERRFVEGASFWELCLKYAGEPHKLAKIFESFCEWYVKYRKLTGLILGDLNPAKFFMTEEGFCYIDFEHCMPGYAEQDIARMVRWFCDESDPSADNPFSEAPLGSFPSAVGAEAAKLFVCVCYGQMQLRGDKLSDFLREEFSTLDSPLPEALISYMTSSGVVVASKTAPAVSEATAFLASSPERFLCGPLGSGLSCPGFDFVYAPNIALAVYAAARQNSCEWLIVLGASSPVDKNAVNELLGTEKSGIDAAFFQGDAFTLPLLIRKETALALFASAGEEDEDLDLLLQEKARCKLI